VPGGRCGRRGGPYYSVLSTSTHFFSRAAGGRGGRGRRAGGGRAGASPEAASAFGLSAGEQEWREPRARRFELDARAQGRQRASSCPGGVGSARPIR
jgi:hypothetical protein